MRLLYGLAVGALLGIFLITAGITTPWWRFVLALTTLSGAIWIAAYVVTTY